eukprot:3586271-Rhodomonas_salina.1
MMSGDVLWGAVWRHSAAPGCATGALRGGRSLDCCQMQRRPSCKGESLRSGVRTGKDGARCASGLGRTWLASVWRVWDKWCGSACHGAWL